MVDVDDVVDARKGGSYEGVCVGPAGSSTAPTRPATIISRDAISPIMMVASRVGAVLEPAGPTHTPS